MRLGLGLNLSLGSSGGAADKDMVLVYAITSPSTNIQLAIQANATWFDTGQSVSINWGDGSAAETVSATSPQTGYVGHTYTSAGTYTIIISGNMKMYGRSSGVDIAGQTLLTHIHSFGKLGITSFSRAFRGRMRLTSVPKTLPSNVTNTYCMFQDCNGAAFNPDVSNWDVSKVTNMFFMFNYCNGAAFNPDVSNWNVSKVENMAYMFGNCYGAAFNPNVTNWDVSNVTAMNSMFGGCSNANFKGGRGVDGLGIGIANWKPKSLSTGATTGLSNFMLSARVQDATYLDSILNAWAALIGDPVNPLPANITATFPANQPYNGSVSGAALTALAAHGWAISTLIDTGN